MTVSDYRSKGSKGQLLFGSSFREIINLLIIPFMKKKIFFFFLKAFHTFSLLGGTGDENLDIA